MVLMSTNRPKTLNCIINELFDKLIAVLDEVIQYTS